MVPGASIGRLSIVRMLPLLLLSFRNDQLGGLRLCLGFRVRVDDEFKFELRNADATKAFFGSRCSTSAPHILCTTL